MFLDPLSIPFPNVSTIYLKLITSLSVNALNKLVPFKVPFKISTCLSLVPLGTWLAVNLKPSNVNTFK